MADRSEVLELLRIADLSKNWPHLKALHDHAMDQLVKAAKDHADKPAVKEPVKEPYKEVAAAPPAPGLRRTV